MHEHFGPGLGVEEVKQLFVVGFDKLTVGFGGDQHGTLASQIISFLHNIDQIACLIKHMAPIGHLCLENAVEVADSRITAKIIVGQGVLDHVVVEATLARHTPFNSPLFDKALIFSLCLDFQFSRAIGRGKDIPNINLKLLKEGFAGFHQLLPERNWFR